MTRLQKRWWTSVACLLVAGPSLPGRAQPEATELIDQQHCMFCHTIDAPFLAPSFRQIADRYRDKPNARAMLERKLRIGGKAHWGDVDATTRRTRRPSIAAGFTNARRL